MTVGGSGPAHGPAAMAPAHAEAARCAATLVALGRGDSAGSADELGFFGLLVGEGRDVRASSRPPSRRCWTTTRSGGPTSWARCRPSSGPVPPRPARPRSLGVHVNTVTQRLERVGRLLGKDWSSPERALEVQLALRLHRLADAGGASRRLLRWADAVRPSRAPVARTSGRARADAHAARIDRWTRRTGSAGAGARPTRSSTSCSPTTPRPRAGSAAGTPARTWRSPVVTGARAARGLALVRDRGRRRRAPRRPGLPGRPGRHGPLRAPPAVRDGRAAGVQRMLRPARVGDGLPRRGHPAPGPAPPRAGGHRRRGRGAPDPLLPLRRVPVLHAARGGPQPAAADPGDPARAGAARLPARGHGPLQVGLQAEPGHARRAGGGLLRAGRGDPRAGHAGLALRPPRARLRAGRRSRPPRARPAYVAAQRGSPSAAPSCALCD